MAIGRNGRQRIGNSSSTTFEHGSSCRTDVSFWSSIADKAVLHSLPMNCAIFSSPKVPGFVDGKLCSQLIQTSARDANRPKISLRRSRRTEKPSSFAVVSKMNRHYLESKLATRDAGQLASNCALTF